MSIVTIPHYIVKCEQCSLSTLGHATLAAARLAFGEYFGTCLPDGRDLCRKHANAAGWCQADRENGEHVADPDQPSECLFCGWPMEIPA